MPKRDTPETRELKRRKSTESQQARESDVGRRNYLLYGERVEYCPSQGEIETACTAIQCEWTDAQERHHRGLSGDDDAAYTIPVVSTEFLREKNAANIGKKKARAKR